ncbi:hypothetical protein DIS24_g8788 [Lasiodiplodia hormozganensis]|uniref:Uncharacterized protein n=1 Tax=Lasiodiplodia hormozganensis TaxID=869390 RepID=A0AA39XYK1_9PEZI|nr:hypothetical protein DIS24_g8788 [Lasiodiplodia hormozganensis]
MDGDTFSMRWSRSTADSPPDLRGIPPLDYTMYLLNTVKFHLGQVLRLFDEEECAAQIEQFYQDPRKKIEESRLWYIQLLLILAFGKALVSPGPKSHSPAGFEFFARAMSIMPDAPDVRADRVLAVEVLALVALYLYCGDMKESAYAYCAILTTRPVLLSLLKERINKHSEQHDSGHVPSHYKPLIRTCANSAVKVIELLTVQLENHMLQTFLPFHLEFVFSACIVVLIVQELLPRMIPDRHLKERADAILEEMAIRGNRPARFRKAELKRLQDLLCKLGDGTLPTTSADPASRTVLSPQLPQPASIALEDMSIEPFEICEHPNRDMHQGCSSDDTSGRGGGFLTSYGLSSDAILSIADQVRLNDLFLEPSSLDESWLP